MTVHLEPEKHLDQIVEVRFLDHVSSDEADQELVIGTVWGRLVHDDWQKIRVRTWETNANELDDDAMFITLVRSAVISVRPLILGD